MLTGPPDIVLSETEIMLLQIVSKSVLVLLQFFDQGFYFKIIKFLLSHFQTHLEIIDLL